jgi:hypothetical protein
MLTTVYPDLEWLPWKFDKCPRHYWEDLKNQRKFLNWLGKELNINNFEEWYKVNKQVGNFPEFSINF